MFSIWALVCWATATASECEMRQVAPPVAMTAAECEARAPRAVLRAAAEMRALGLAVNSALPVCQRGSAT